MAVTGFHPILYVEDPGEERDFYTRFGFETAYEGDDFPGFIAVRCGAVVFGLSRNRQLTGDAPYDAVRWQLTVQDPADVTRICEAEGWSYSVEVEAPSAAHRSRTVRVRSPNGLEVWFEGPNEAAAEQ